ncbi:MAG TPA: nucleotide pyrophosphatase/phosphodiesterase family protein [Jatrophihabitans sp.]|nr:nucleotide pyrophosphatase/phosphodiesterase family protein [Jatrophihabitans sp.]
MPANRCDVLPAAAAALGVPGGVDRIGLSDSDARRVVVLLLDGMGYHLLPTMAPHAPLLASVVSRSAGRLDELVCTFPSTTPTSLVSLGTGARPGQHGVLGFTLRVPGTSRILTHIFWRDDPPPAQWQPLGTWFERIAAAGRPVSVVLPAAFAGSGLTDAAYRGGRFIGVGERDDFAAALLNVARGAAGLTYGYIANLDTAAHLHGIDSPQWQQAAAQIDRLLTRIVAELPADALLLVTADHGGLNVPLDERYDVDTDPHLSDAVQFVTGEPRARYLHTTPGAAADVVATWTAVLGERATVHTRDEIVESGLFGPVRPEHLARLGDVVVICTGPTAIIATKREPALLSGLIGYHGALTPAETAIPLITFYGTTA